MPEQSSLSDHHAEQEPDSDLTDMDELETKLDLAKAYVDMGDADAAKDIAKEAEAISPGEQQKKAEASFGATLGTGLTGAIMPALSLFANTLLSKMVDNYRTKGMFPFGICKDCGNKLQDTLNNLEGQASPGGRQAAEARPLSRRREGDGRRTTLRRAGSRRRSAPVPASQQARARSMADRG